MKSVIELDINLHQARVAALFADPNNNPRWMGEIERIEAVSGSLGQPGSVYRLVPKRGKLVFVATVVTVQLPNELTVSLDAASVSVMVRATLFKLSEERTKLISEETFRFKGALNNLFGLFGRRAIKAAHRRHMESFKRFAESHR